MSDLSQPSGSQASGVSAESQPAQPMGHIAARGAAWLGMSQIARVVLMMLSTIVIARILSPDQYGVVAMVGPLFALVAMLQDLGLGAATIQARGLTDEQSNALFWINLAMSAGLAVLVACLAPLVGWFYGDVRPAWVTLAGAGTVLVTGLALQQAALLNRHMKFATISAIDMAALVANYTVVLITALLLRSYWALVLGTLAGACVQTGMTWYASGFRPGRPHVRGVGEMARFGGHLTGFTLLNFLVRNLDDVLVARFAGAAAAGLYDRSYRLMMMPLQTLNGPLNRLLQPMLAQVRDEPARFRRIFSLAARGVMLVIAAPVAVAVANADDVMLLLLGDRWTGAGPIFFWLGLAALIQPVANLTGLLFIISGRGKAMLRWGVVSAVVTVAGFAAGIGYGAVGIAAAFFWSLLVRLPVLFAWSTASTPVRQGDLYAAQIAPLLGAGAVAEGCRMAGLDAGASPWELLPLLAAETAAAYASSVLTSCLTANGRQQVGELAGFALTYLARIRVRQAGSGK
ncbi:MAG: lipopolysaccharide biosynthesis protein [Novosphingobium sp.]